MDTFLRKNQDKHMIDCVMKHQFLVNQSVLDHISSVEKEFEDKLSNLQEKVDSEFVKLEERIVNIRNRIDNPKVYFENIAKFRKERGDNPNINEAEANIEIEDMILYNDDKLDSTKFDDDDLYLEKKRNREQLKQEKEKEKDLRIQEKKNKGKNVEEDDEFKKNHLKVAIAKDNLSKEEHSMFKMRVKRNDSKGVILMGVCDKQVNCSMNFFENINDKNFNNNNKSIFSIISINITNLKISSKIDNIYIELNKKNYFNFLKILEINNEKYHLY